MKYVVLIISIIVAAFAFLYMNRKSNDISESFVILVNDNEIDFSSIGIDAPFTLTGDKKIDHDHAFRFVDSINVPKEQIIDDKNGLLKNEMIFYKPQIIIKSKNAIYAAYIANMISKIRFCFGSKIIYDADTLSNACINRNPMYWEPTNNMPPSYSIIMTISDTESFCLNKKYVNNLEYKYEGLCFDKLDLIERCGFEFIYDERNDSIQFNECRTLANEIDSLEYESVSRNMIIVDRSVAANIAIRKVNEYKKLANSFIKDKVKDSSMRRLLSHDIEWTVE